jgi:RES domain
LSTARVDAFATAIAALSLKQESGTWVRAIPAAYLSVPPPGAPAGAFPNPLWSGGTHLSESRYIPKGMCDAYHIAEGSSTGIAELEQTREVVADPVFGVPRTDTLILRVEWSLTGILDVCDEAVRRALDVELAALVSLPGLFDALEASDDVTVETVPQQIGRAAYGDSRVSAICYPSARRSGGRNIVVFTERLTSSSGQYLQTRDPVHQRVFRVPSP